MTKAAVAIVVLFALLYILPLGVRPMLIPDEMRYAEMGREMVASGDWIVPRLNGLRYFEKPVLGHWLHALSIKVFGLNSFAIRLPSALAAGLSALILFFFIRRFTGDAVIAMITASIFLTCLEVYAVGTFCVLDSIFSMFITGSLVSVFCALTESRSRKKMAFLVISGVACGLAFLTKGFLAFVMLGLVFVPLAVWQQRFKAIAGALAVVFLTAVGTALPWSIMIDLREPDFWHYFFLVEHVNRFMSPGGSQHPNPYWYFVPCILAGTLPWTAQIIAVISRLGRTRLQEPLLRFAACWFVFPFLFFSACRGKLGTYILPCFPPILVVFAIGLRQELSNGGDQRFGWSARAGLTAIAAMAVVLLLTQTLAPHARLYGPGETLKWLVVTAGLLAYGALLMRALRTTRPSRRFALFCLAPLPLIFSAPFAIPDRLIAEKSPAEFLQQHKDMIDKSTIIVSDKHLISAVCWSYRRSDVFLMEEGGELTYGLRYGDSRQRLLDIDQLKKLIAASPTNASVALVINTETYERYKRLLPEPISEDVNGHFTFAGFAPQTASVAEH